MRLFLAIVGFVAWVGCAPKPNPPEGEPLYFSMEVRRQGRLVAKPKLLGTAGVKVQAERRQPGASEADYRLMLDSENLGETFQVQLDLALPEAHGRTRVALVHGQEAQVQLGSKPGELEVSLLLMRVDSPEFRALMELATLTPAGSGAI